MKKLRSKIFIGFISIFLLSIFTTNTFAQSSTTTSDDTAGAAFFAFMGVYYLILCIMLLAHFIHMILSIIVLIDISKRSNDSLNKDMWILGLLLPSSFLFSWMGGIFVSLGLEIYYLIAKKKQLDNN